MSTAPTTAGSCPLCRGKGNCFRCLDEPCVCDGDLCEGRSVICSECEREVAECTAIGDRWCHRCAQHAAEVCS